MPASSVSLGRWWAQGCPRWRLGADPRSRLQLGVWTWAARPGCRGSSPHGVCRVTLQLLPARVALGRASLPWHYLLEPSQPSWALSGGVPPPSRHTVQPEAHPKDSSTLGPVETPWASGPGLGVLGREALTAQPFPHAHLPPSHPPGGSQVTAAPSCLECRFIPPLPSPRP